jgi:hypothetical protein
MKEIPILFNAEMVRAILEGKKTQTRRPFKYQPTECWKPDRFCVLHQLKDGHFPLRNGHPIPIGYGVVNYDGDVGYVSPFGNVGDHLWVRETFGPCEGGVIYKADELEAVKPDGGKWTPSIHMPRWASRITLLVTDIRVQRVKEISEEDAIAEGIDLKGYRSNTFGISGREHRIEFSTLWQSIYNTWDANPWVWAATFEVVK